VSASIPADAAAKRRSGGGGSDHGRAQLHHAPCGRQRRRRRPRLGAVGTGRRLGARHLVGSPVADPRRALPRLRSTGRRSIRRWRPDRRRGPSRS